MHASALFVRSVGIAIFTCAAALGIPRAAFADEVATDAASPLPASSSEPGNNDKAPASTRNPNSAPTAAPMSFPGVLGDFGHGERADLAKHGFALNAHLTTEGASNLTGGLPLGGTAEVRGTGLSSEFGFGFDADFGKLAAGSGAGILHFLLTTRFGSNLSAEAIGNLSSVEEIYGDGQTTRITFMDYEQPLAHQKLNLRLGKYNQQNDFIAGSTYWGGDLYCYYMNNYVCGTPSGIPVDNGVVANGSEGYTYYPSSQWGARLKVNVSPDTYVQVAAIQANPIVNNANGGLYLGFNGGTGTELPAEIGVTLRDRSGALVGNVRVGGYFDTSNVQGYATRAGSALTLTPYETSRAGLASNAAAVAALPTQYVRGRSGAYTQIDHLISGSAEPKKRGSTIFTSFQYSDPQTSLIGTFFEIGAVRHGTFAGRPEDTLALGFATANYNGRLQQLETRLQSRGNVVPTTVQDQDVELNYGVQVAPWITLRPNFQYVINPGGIKANPGAGILDSPRNAFVIGLGSYITF